MGSNARPVPQVRGREQQVAQITANLRGVASTRRSKALLVEAAPGAGKTRLLAEAVHIAGRTGFTVVGGVPAASDAAPLPAVPRSRPPGAAEDGPRARSAPPAGGPVPAIESAQAWLRNAPEAVRAVVVLDDLHLANLPALSALCDLIAAFRDRPILWLLAFTAPDGGNAPHRPTRSCLSRLRERLPVEAVRGLGPLPGDALRHLVADCAGADPAPDVLALAESVDRTPRAVIELVNALVEDGDVRVHDGAARLRAETAGGTSGGAACVPAPVPEGFAALLRKELRSLAEPTVKALRLAAVLGSPFAPEDLSGMLGEGPVGLLAAVDEAVDRGFVVCHEHSLAFRTEPIWRVLLDSVPPPVRAMLRRQAAEMLLKRPDGVERAALQLVHVAQPHGLEDMRIIAEGSRRLLATDPPAAASLAARCMELAPAPAERVRLAKTAVDALTRAGDLDRAITLATDTLDGTPPAAPAEAIAALRASLSTALLLLGKAAPAHRAARAALAAGERGVPDGEAVITQLAASYLTGGGTAAGRARRILGAPDRHPQAVRGAALTFEAFGRWREGRAGDAVQALRQAVALGRAAHDVRLPHPLVDPRWFLAFALVRTDEFEEAAAVAQRSPRTAGTQGKVTADASDAVLRAPLHLAQGRLAEAEAAARAGAGMDGPHVPMLAPQAWLVLAQVALRRGALTQAEDHLRTLEQEFPQPASSPWWAARLLLRAQVVEAGADPRATADLLARIAASGDALRLLVLEDPAAAAWCVRAALAAETPGAARAVVDTAEHLRVRNEGVPAVLAAAVHARALAEGDAQGLARAAQLHRNPWARAAAAEDLAGLLRARGDHQEAVRELDRALNAYGALGGERDAARVRALLRGLGVRRRHWTHAKRPGSGWESLTKTERKVAELVADGLTNQQVARHLFISPHTVGFHLRQIYRKLGIRSRTALVRLTV